MSKWNEIGWEKEVFKKEGTKDEKDIPQIGQCAAKILYITIYCESPSPFLPHPLFALPFYINIQFDDCQTFVDAVQLIFIVYLMSFQQVGELALNFELLFTFCLIPCQKNPLCRFCNESMQPLLTLKGAQQMNFTKAVYLQNNKKFITNFNIQRQSSKWHDPHIRLKFIFCNIFWTCCNFKSTLLKP